MAEINAYIIIHVEGPEIRPSRMRLDDFLRIAGEFSTAAKRVALVLQASKGSTRGRRSDELYESLSLDLIGFTQGSPAAVAYLERSFGQRLIPSFDLGESAYTALLRGLESLSDTSVAWPEGFDTGVAFVIRDMGKTFTRGVNRVSFTVNHRTNSLTATLDAEKLAKIRARLAQPEPEIITVEARLMMVDLKESRSKFRIDRAFGTSIICDFPDEMEFQIPEFLKSHVKVQGRAQYNAEKEIARFQVLSIEKVGDSEVRDLLPIPPDTPRFDPQRVSTNSRKNRVFNLHLNSRSF